MPGAPNDTVYVVYSSIYYVDGAFQKNGGLVKRQKSVCCWASLGEGRWALPRSAYLERRASVEDVAVVEGGDALVVEAKVRDTGEKVVIRLVPPASFTTDRFVRGGGILLIS